MSREYVKANQGAIRSKGGFRQLKRPDSDAHRTIGFGAKPNQDRLKAGGREGLGDLIESILSCRACPTYNMPVIEQVRWTLGGPLLDADVNSDFGAEIDLFGSGKNVPGIDFVETTMAQPGQLQTPTLVCAIGFHLEPEPLCFTVQGNAWTHPTAGGAQPPSPDVFTQNDRANGALGTAIGAGTTVMVPAVYEHGWWANYAAWHMVRGYDLRWKIGQHTNIMDEVLRHTAYMPPSAQEGSASSSQVDVIDFVRQLNERYVGTLGSALDFLKITHLRLGSVTVGGSNVGVFKPSRAFQVVGATYGGMDLRSMLKGNSEFRQLTVPYLIQAGIPIGLVCQESDSVEADNMRRYLSATQAQNAGVPPLITDDGNINAGATAIAGANVSLEQTLDAAPINVSQTIDSDVAVYKGGELKVSMLLKGFEVDGDWAAVLNANPDLRKAVMDECGCSWASR